MNELDNAFAEITKTIEKARENAYRKVNEELILMYRKVGQFLSEKSKESSYDDRYIDSLAEYVQQHLPGIKGFSRRGLYRMEQFYETYAGKKIVSLGDTIKLDGIICSFWQEAKAMKNGNSICVWQ